MPKYKKCDRQRRLNAQRMHNYLTARKGFACAKFESGESSSTEQHFEDNTGRVRKGSECASANVESGESSSISEQNLEDNTGITTEQQCTEEEVVQLLSDETVDMEELPFSIETEKNENFTEKKVGRRIIDVSFFLAELKRISQHGPLGCGFNEMKIIGEKQNGLQSQFTFKCLLCNEKFCIESDNCNDNYLLLNKCAVAGTIATGGGSSQLTELLSAMNLPVLSEKTYLENHDFISKKWEEVSVETMQKAAEEERQFAISSDRVNKDGIPVIDVIADGCWSKRSYKKNYNALSGAAAIIGRNSGKILYLGIKNKYCFTCARADKNKVDPELHKCFKNYVGPSTNMESEIIVEGFKDSIKTHNLIYGRLISDGDANTYSKILKARPYSDITVEKVECRNHVLRNFCNKLQALSTDTKYNIQNRKLITIKAILGTRGAITRAIQKHKNNSDVQLLYEDIMVSHRHGFGDHSKCKPYFCEKVGTIDVSNEFLLSTLWQRISLLTQNIAGHARSLILDVDSNIVERYNSVIAKFVGGKRVNFSLRNSYQTRCHAAAVAFNQKKSISRLYKLINKGASPRGKLSSMERKRIHKNEKNKLTKKPKNRTLFQKQTLKDHNYGPDCLKPDVPAEILNALKESFLQSLKKTEKERRFIERKTVLQSESSEWLELRRSLLTASSFGKVITRRNDTSCHNIVKDLLYKKNIDHVSSIKHGKENEKIAITQLERQENIKIEPCGLFIDEHLPFLGATPDGLCGSDTIIEIKCPITASKLGLDEAIKKKKINFWKATKNTIQINENHQWYYQIQGQLHVTKKIKCLFAVWTNEHTQLKIEIIKRDDTFWHEKMEEKLKLFYLNCILPELVDPRYPRGMNIRNPAYIEEAIEKKKKSKENIKPGMSRE